MKPRYTCYAWAQAVLARHGYRKKVGELIPEEDKLEITTLSVNAFYYFGKDELKYKLLLLEDMDAEDVLYPIRELQSKRKISKCPTVVSSRLAVLRATSSDASE